MSIKKNEKLSEKSYAYTPGLKVKKSEIIRKTRRLPLLGEILVKMGDKVDFDTIVARTEVPGEPYIIEATNIMGLNPAELPKYMVKKVGDVVNKGETIAQWIALFGLIKRIVTSPIDGIIESTSELTGRVIIRRKPTVIEIKSYIPGNIVDIIPREGVIIETNAAYLQGIFGIGPERHGQLKVLVNSPNEALIPDLINSKHNGKIIIGGSFITLEALIKANENKVAGIVVGGINAVDLNKFLGYTMGVAITGEENIETTLIITEGLGKMSMSLKTFELLRLFNEEEAAINGATQIRAGVLRPEIIIPHKMVSETITGELEGGLKTGTLTRIIRTPYFGRIGTVVNLPVELHELETESKARVVSIKLENGEEVIVPRANVEIIEE